MTRVLLLLLALTSFVLANPEPDIPVHCHFDQDGSCTIQIEVDPRCFTAEPMSERYVMKVDLTYRSPEALEDLKAKAREALLHWVQFQFDPPTKLTPEFNLAFTGQNQSPLVKADDPIVITATWKFQLPEGMKSLQVQATQDARYSMVVRYDIHGIEQKEFATLFPGEASFKMAPPTK